MKTALEILSEHLDLPDELVKEQLDGGGVSLTHSVSLDAIIEAMEEFAASNHDKLIEALKGVIRESDRKTDAYDKAKSLLTSLESSPLPSVTDTVSDEEIALEVVAHFLTRNPHPKSKIYLEWEKKAFIAGMKRMRELMEVKQ